MSGTSMGQQMPPAYTFVVASGPLPAGTTAHMLCAQIAEFDRDQHCSMHVPDALVLGPANLTMFASGPARCC